VSKTMPGAEREQRRQLRWQVAHLDRQLHMHVKECAMCAHAGSDVYAHCSYWWELARKLHVARRRQSAFEHAPNPDQLALPGMEEE